MTGYGTMTPELEAWMEAHRDPKWKHKPYVVPKLAKVSAPRRSAEFAQDVSRWQYSRGFDYRQIREPVSLERFMELKHDPKWKMPAFKIGRLHPATRYAVAQERDAIQWVTDLVRRHNGALESAA